MKYVMVETRWRSSSVFVCQVESMKNKDVIHKQWSQNYSARNGVACQQDGVALHVVRVRVDFEVLLLAFKCLKSLGSSHLSELLLSYRSPQTLRSSSSGLLLVPHANTNTHGEWVHGENLPLRHPWIGLCVCAGVSSGHEPEWSTSLVPCLFVSFCIFAIGGSLYRGPKPTNRGIKGWGQGGARSMTRDMKWHMISVLLMGLMQSFKSDLDAHGRALPFL